MYMYLDLSAIYQIKFKMDLIKLATDDRMEIIEQDTCTLTYSGNFESLASAFAILHVHPYNYFLLHAWQY